MMNYWNKFQKPVELKIWQWINYQLNWRFQAKANQVFKFLYNSLPEFISWINSSFMIHLVFNRRFFYMDWVEYLTNCRVQQRYKYCIIWMFRRRVAILCWGCKDFIYFSWDLQITSFSIEKNVELLEIIRFT